MLVSVCCRGAVADKARAPMAQRHKMTSPLPALRQNPSALRTRRDTSCAGTWGYQWCTEMTQPFTQGTDRDMFFCPNGTFYRKQNCSHWVCPGVVGQSWCLARMFLHSSRTHRPSPWDRKAVSGHGASRRGLSTRCPCRTMLPALEPPHTSSFIQTRVGACRPGWQAYRRRLKHRVLQRRSG